MIGSKPMSGQEVKMILSKLTNLRDKTLVILGIKTGYRIGELLSLTVDSVVQYGKIRDEITVERKSMKGKHKSRSVVLHDEAKKALIEMGVLEMNPKDRLFPISKVRVHNILKAAVEKGKIEGKVSSHSFRKTFAKKIYHALGKDLVKTQKALGHESINSTVSYLSFEQSEIDNAIKNS